MFFYVYRIVIIKKKKINKSVLKRKALKARKMIIQKMRLFFAVRKPST